MKKKTAGKLALAKIRISHLSKLRGIKIINGKPAACCTDAEFCPTLETCAF